MRLGVLNGPDSVCEDRELGLEDVDMVSQRVDFALVGEGFVIDDPQNIDADLEQVPDSGLVGSPELGVEVGLGEYSGHSEIT